MESKKIIEADKDYFIYSDGQILSYARNTEGLALEPVIGKENLLEVSFRSNGSLTTIYVHDLVAKYFLPGYGRNNHITFKDGSRFNCAADNLCLVDPDDISIIANVVHDVDLFEYKDIPDLDVPHYINSEGHVINQKGNTVKPVIKVNDRVYCYRLPSRKKLRYFAAASLVGNIFLKKEKESLSLERKGEFEYISFRDGDRTNIKVSNLRWKNFIRRKSY
jgi:hypothetical protein